jgi:hypothetical protein
MKFNIKIVLGLFVFLITTYSCSNDVTYADQLKAEKELIKDYIKRNNIKVVSEMPTTFPWPDNVYYKSTTGLYFRLTNQGDSIFDGDTIRAQDGDVIVTRYIQYTLDTESDTISSWTTLEYAFPTTFDYLSDPDDWADSDACAGWMEVVSYMKYMNAEAKVIVPSKIGFSTYTDDVIPMGYDMKIKIQRD